MKALTDVSFDIKKGEIRAIIGPNGAGKTSMLNCINGFYHPTSGRTSPRADAQKMRPVEAAAAESPHTFQNVALFKGMTTLDNIMAGRSLKMTSSFFWQIFRYGPALDEEVRHRRVVEDIIDFLEIQHIRRCRSASCLRVAEAGGTRPRPRHGARILLLDEPMAGMNLEEKEDMSASSST